jgi:MoaA/NifB/PqqE/SkfB family radical SAM enzyme
MQGEAMGSEPPEERRVGRRLRSLDILTMISPRAAWQLLRGVVRAPFDPGFAGHPLAVCWFTNFSCNARCAFCCKAREIREGRDAFPPLRLDRAKALLERIRATVNLLFLSGGEPTLHPELPDLLREARRQGFSSIGMSTNLIEWGRRPEIAEFLDALCVSLHSTDVQEHAEALGVPARTAETIFENLEGLRSGARGRGPRILINCVVTPQNLGRVLDLVGFTRERGFLLEIVPANDRGRMPKGLPGNPEYVALIDRLLEMRGSGEASHLAGSTGYYRRIREFEPFRCFPYGVPNVMPDGRLCTPCDVSGQHAVNVLDHADLQAAVRASLPHLGSFPCRAGRCFKAGIVERSRLFGLLDSGGTPED